MRLRRTGVVFATAMVAGFGALAPVASSGSAEGQSSPIFGVKIPAGYRAWQLISIAHESGLDELRAVLGNPMAIKAFQTNALPFPDGTMLVKLAWKHTPLSGQQGAFVAGPATTVQVMVKDTKRYGATGGWGFGRFTDGVPADAAQHQTCFACHDNGANNHDFVFTNLSR